MVNFGVPVFCGQHRSRRVSLKAMLQDPNKWTERDERLLALLLQKRAACDVEGDFGPPSMHVGSPGTGVAEGYGAGNMGAMHDGAKRRLTADTPATSSDWEKLEPTYVGEVIVENDTEEALVAALDASAVGTMSWLSAMVYKQLTGQWATSRGFEWCKSSKGGVKI